MNDLSTHDFNCDIPENVYFLIIRGKRVDSCVSMINVRMISAAALSFLALRALTKCRKNLFTMKHCSGIRVGVIPDNGSCCFSDSPIECSFARQSPFTLNDARGMNSFDAVRLSFMMILKQLDSVRTRAKMNKQSGLVESLQ